MSFASNACNFRKEYIEREEDKREDTMSHLKYLESTARVEEGKKEWSSAAKLILAFILGFLLLSPAILGIYWEMLLPK
jgi:hypothetical protein